MESTYKEIASLRDALEIIPPKSLGAASKTYQKNAVESLLFFLDSTKNKSSNFTAARKELLKLVPEISKELNSFKTKLAKQHLDDREFTRLKLFLKLAEESAINVSDEKISRRSIKADILLATGVLTALYFLSVFVSGKYVESINKPLSSSQSNYQEIGSTEQLKGYQAIAWYELGRDRTLFRELNTHPWFLVGINGFNVQDKWDRDVYWSARTNSRAEVLVRLKDIPASTNSDEFLVALYLTDGDSDWRTSRVESGKTKYLAWDLHNGKWFTFPITKDDLESKEKRIKLQHLTGGDVALSAIIIAQKE